MPPQTQIRTIRIVTDTKQAKGLKDLSRQFGRMNRQVSNISSNFGTLRRVFQAAIAGLGAREIARSADAFQLLRDRIKVFVGSAEEANRVFGEIRNLARFTRASVETFAEGYNRVAISTQGLGITTQDTLKIVTSLQQSLRLSGATAQEASSVFIQLGQALSLGRLQGQELRSVLLSNAVIAQLLAREFDTTTGALRELGEQGQITADRVIKVLLENFDSLNQRAGELNVTFGQVLILAFDAFRAKIDELNTRFNLSSNFFKGLSFFIENMKQIFKVVVALVGPSLFLRLAAQIQAFVTQTVAAVAASGGLIGAIKTTRIAATALFTVFSYLAIEALTNWEKFQLTVRKGLATLKISSSEFFDGFYKGFKRINILGRFNPLQGVVEGLQLANKLDLAKTRGELEKVNAELDKLKIKKTNQWADLLGQIDKTDNGKLKELNGEFNKLNYLLGLGYINMNQYRDAVDRLALEKLAKDFADGKISVDQYNDSLNKFGLTFDAITNKTRSSSMTDGLIAGAREFNETTRNLAGQIKDVTLTTFNDLEDRLFTFARTGKFEFKEFAQVVADELTRLAIRLVVIRNLTQGLQAYFGGQGPAPATDAPGGYGSGSGGLYAAAKGAVVGNGRIQAFANGGIVNSPTLFPLSNGAGLMGEAGPEAILPLRRGPGGKLGVEAGGGTVVNVINNSRGQVETRERTGQNGEKQIDVVIIDRMTKAFAEGKMDKVMSNTYGVRRKGN